MDITKWMLWILCSHLIHTSLISIQFMIWCSTKCMLITKLSQSKRKFQSLIQGTYLLSYKRLLMWVLLRGGLEEEKGRRKMWKRLSLRSLRNKRRLRIKFNHWFLMSKWKMMWMKLWLVTFKLNPMYRTKTILRGYQNFPR